MEQGNEPDAQTPRAQAEDLGEEGCLMLDPKWREDVYEGEETLLRGFYHGQLEG